MMKPTGHLVIVSLLAVVFLGVTATPAVAQSDAQLRRENERLRSEAETLRNEVTDLKQRLADLEASNRALQERIRQLRAGSSAGGSTPVPPPPPPPVSIDESKPDASPRALLNAVTASYAEATKDLDPGTPGRPDRLAFMRELDRWSKRANREHRTPIEWHVKEIGRDRTRAGYIYHLVAVDPVHGTELGDPFDALVPAASARRLSRLREHAESDVMVLKGTLQPMITINPDRSEVGTFDNPRFIGPYAEFGFGVIATSLMPDRPEEEATAGAATP